jgi:hypothetical protein
VVSYSHEAATPTMGWGDAGRVGRGDGG